MTQDTGSLPQDPTLPMHAVLPSDALTEEKLECLTQILPDFQAPPACPAKGQLGSPDSVNTIANPTMIQDKDM